MPYNKDRFIEEYISKKINEVSAQYPPIRHELRYIPAAQGNSWFWYGDLRNYKMCLGAFVPEDIHNFVGPDTLCTSFSCELNNVFEIFYREYNNAATEYSSYVYIGAGSIQSHFQQAFPPILPIHIDTNLSYAYLAGWIHIVTKEGLQINGVSYPAAHIEVRSGD